MPRVSIADHLFMGSEEISSESHAKWIVLYNFSKNPPTNFYKNLDRLSSYDPYAIKILGGLVTVRGRVAVAAVSLGMHYGVSVRLYLGRDALSIVWNALPNDSAQ